MVVIMVVLILLVVVGGRWGMVLMEVLLLELAVMFGVECAQTLNQQ